METMTEVFTDRHDTDSQCRWFDELKAWITYVQIEI